MKLITVKIKPQPLELWKDVKGYEGRYRVSTLGRVKSLNSGLIMTENIRKNGYVYVVLHKNGVVKKEAPHRLVAEAFIPNPENKPYVDHINTIKNDNRKTNLRWVTPHENNQNSITMQRYKKLGEDRGKPIYGVKKDSGFIIYFPSLSEAQKMGFTRRNIQACLRGKRKTCMSFSWFYVKE